MAKHIMFQRRKIDTASTLPSAEEVGPGEGSNAKLLPPSLTRAASALAKLDKILKPPRHAGRGYKPCKLDRVTRTRCEVMAICLRQYIDLPRRSFSSSSSKAAKMSGKGPVSYARRIRRWIRTFMATGDLPTHRLGSQNISVINNEGVVNELKLLLRSKGKYLSAEDLMKLLNDPDIRKDVGVPKPITLRTARRWLRKMGYRWKSEPKGQYFDGHERADVVHYRTHVFLPIWKSIEPFIQGWDDETGLPVPLMLKIGQRQIIIWFHDETTFYAHDRRRRRWVHRNERPIPWKKGEGVSMGVSDFISECGFLHGRDG